MKTIETPLTFVLLILCFGLTSKIYFDRVGLEEEKAKLEERKSKTISVEVDHDSDPETNTKIVTVSSHLKKGTDEGDKITYSWKQDKGQFVELNGDDQPVMSFEAKAGEYEFTLTATDNYGASSSEKVIVSIGKEPNEAPVPIINYGKEESSTEDDSSSENEDEAAWEDASDQEKFQMMVDELVIEQDASNSTSLDSEVEIAE